MKKIKTVWLFVAAFIGVLLFFLAGAIGNLRSLIKELQTEGGEEK